MIDAEEIVELVWPSWRAAQFGLDSSDWNFAMIETDKWAAEQCYVDGKYKQQALEWLALSEDERADACEAYLGAVRDRYRVAFED